MRGRTEWTILLVYVVLGIGAGLAVLSWALTLDQVLRERQAKRLPALVLNSEVSDRDPGVWRIHVRVRGGIHSKNLRTSLLGEYREAGEEFEVLLFPGDPVKVSEYKERGWWKEWRGLLCGFAIVGVMLALNERSWVMRLTKRVQRRGVTRIQLQSRKAGSFD